MTFTHTLISPQGQGPHSPMNSKMYSEVGKLIRKAANNNDVKTLEMLFLDPNVKFYINEPDMSGTYRNLLIF